MFPARTDYKQRMQFIPPVQADWDQKTAQALETATRVVMNPQPHIQLTFSAFRIRSATFFSGRMLPKPARPAKIRVARAPPDFNRSR